MISDPFWSLAVSKPPTSMMSDLQENLAPFVVNLNLNMPLKEDNGKLPEELGEALSLAAAHANKKRQKIKGKQVRTALTHDPALNFLAWKEYFWCFNTTFQMLCNSSVWPLICKDRILGNRLSVIPKSSQYKSTTVLGMPVWALEKE